MAKNIPTSPYPLLTSRSEHLVHYDVYCGFTRQKLSEVLANTPQNAVVQIIQNEVVPMDSQNDKDHAFSCKGGRIYIVRLHHEPETFHNTKVSLFNDGQSVMIFMPEKKAVELAHSILSQIMNRNPNVGRIEDRNATIEFLDQGKQSKKRGKQSKKRCEFSICVQFDEDTSTLNNRFLEAE